MTAKVLEDIRAQKKVRNSRDRLLLYFAYTVPVLRDTPKKWGPRYGTRTSYDVEGFDTLDELKEYKTTLLSLIDLDLNAYTLVIVNKLENKILNRWTHYPSAYRVSSKLGCKPDQIEGCHFGEEKIKPTLHYDPGNKLAELDFFFRGPGEVPEDYKWDDGEYEGWLQYRWGDGKNAL